MPRNDTASPDSQEFQDCTPCRLMGSATFIGLGAYCMTVKEEQSLPPPKGPLANAFAKYRGRIPGVIGVGFIAAGIYRLLI